MSSAWNLEETSGRGLSSEEARQRLARDGYNELPSATRRNTLAIALSIAREPMFLLLILSAIIYFILGDVRESLVLSLSLIVILPSRFFRNENPSAPWKPCARW